MQRYYLRIAAAFGKGAIISGMPYKGRLAQLVEHLVYTERVSGSSPLAPTMPFITVRSSSSNLCGCKNLMMRIGKFVVLWSLAVMTLVVAHPAFANNKDRTKRTDAQTECNEPRKSTVRSMSESTPQRKNDCPKTRRILM